MKGEKIWKKFELMVTGMTETLALKLMTDLSIENYHGPNEIKEMRIFGHCVDIFKDVKLDSDRKTYQSNDIYLASDTTIDEKKYFVERG